MIRLVPELAQTVSVAQPPALDSPGAQGRFCAALLGTLAAALGLESSDMGPGAVLAVEDVHWVDESSAEVLAYLVRRLREIPLLLVLTWRPESLPRVSPLHTAVAGAVRAGLATNVDLDRLDRGAVATLAAAALAEPPSDEAVGRLWQETGGMALFVAEYLQSFRHAGRMPADGRWQLPGGIRDLLQGRLAGVSTGGGGCAALNNLALLQAVVGRRAEALELAREALRVGLEQGDRHRSAALHTNLADLLHDTGEQDEARHHLMAAARLFAGVDDEQLRRPEIWKLASW